ncbi:MAG TPA: metal-dependent hydrolase [Kofleriaceae bacterium]|nr:metal-dependent hydrolase [Kofleriaceae bacterium]
MTPAPHRSPSPAPSPAPSKITPRDFDADLAAVPRHWMANNAAATAVANGVNLLFPHGERFFVRSVKHFLPQIEDPALRAAIKGFFGQEGRHAHAHDEFNDILRHQGFEVDQFLASYKKISSWLESKFPAKLNLAITAAAEHFTAILAEGAFKHRVLDRAAPQMQQLLAWHAAEEIEHKAVAFDVLKAVDPSYLLRVLGLVGATAILGGFWAWGALVLMRQEHTGPLTAWRQLGQMPRRDPIVLGVFVRGIREYLRPAFHPRDNANEGLAHAWMTERGMAMPGEPHEAA